MRIPCRKAFSAAMRYGVISDIHANLEALLAVLDVLEGEAIDIYHHIDREALRRSYLAHIPKVGI